MSSLSQVMQVVDSHHISNKLLESESKKFGGLITNGQYAWFASETNIFLYSKQLGSIISSKSFAEKTNKSIKVRNIFEQPIGKKKTFPDIFQFKINDFF